MSLLKDKNFEVYIFAGDPNKGQATWMYSLRFGDLAIRGSKGGESIHHCLKQAADHIVVLQRDDAENRIPNFA